MFWQYWGGQNLGTSLPMSKLTWQDVFSWFWQLEHNVDPPKWNEWFWIKITPHLCPKLVGLEVNLGDILISRDSKIHETWVKWDMHVKTGCEWMIQKFRLLCRISLFFPGDSPLLCHQQTAQNVTAIPGGGILQMVSHNNHTVKRWCKRRLRSWWPVDNPRTVCWCSPEKDEKRNDFVGGLRKSLGGCRE